MQVNLLYNGGERLNRCTDIITGDFSQGFSSLVPIGKTMVHVCICATKF